MAGEIGKAAAEELQGKLEVDEQNKLANESDETYDAELLTHLREKLKPEVEAFNSEAQAADQLKLENGTGMIQFFKDNKPVFAVLVKSRTLHFLDAPADSANGSASKTFRATGGPEEYAYLSGDGDALAEEDLIKGLIRTAAGARFQAE